MELDAILAMPASELEHHGVKGMKWGVRKDKGHEGKRATTKKIAKLDKKFETLDRNKFMQVYQKTSQDLNNDIIPRVNAKPKYKNTDFTDPKNKKIYEQYNKEFAVEATKSLNRHSKDIIGTNASGTRKVIFGWNPTNSALPQYLIVDTDVDPDKVIKHADPIEIELEFDGDGLITKMTIPGSLAQSVIAELEHYGVPGMKWGKRKASAAVSRATTRVKEEVSSKKREYGVRKSYANRANMSPDELKRVSNRAAAEQRIKNNLSTQFKNQLKSGRVIIDKPLMNDRKLYRNRGKMSDQILRQFENRVNLETQMSRVYTKTQDRDFKNVQKVIDSYSQYKLPIKK